MIYLIKKDIRLNRWFFLVTVVVGLPVMIVAGLNKPESMLLLALFIQMIFSHMIFSFNRQSAQLAKENKLLNSLPLTRKRIVTGKYLFCMLCTIFNATWLSGISLIMSWFGVENLVPPFFQWGLLICLGSLYFIMMLPVSYISPQYGALIALIVYFAILWLPSKLADWLGANSKTYLQQIIDLSVEIGRWILPATVTVLFVLLVVSLRLAQRVYQKTEI